MDKIKQNISNIKGKKVMKVLDNVGQKTKKKKKKGCWNNKQIARQKAIFTVAFALFNIGNRNRNWQLVALAQSWG